MAQLKTLPTGESVTAFLEEVPDEIKRNDCRTLLGIMKRATGSQPRMWGHSIVGFGTYHYTYTSGREGDWFLTGFSPRKQDLTIYIMPGFDRYTSLMHRLGKHKTGKSCLYIKRISEINLAVLKELIGQSVRHMKAKYR